MPASVSPTATLGPMDPPGWQPWLQGVHPGRVKWGSAAVSVLIHLLVLLALILRPTSSPPPAAEGPRAIVVTVAPASAFPTTEAVAEVPPLPEVAMPSPADVSLPKLAALPKPLPRSEMQPHVPSTPEPPPRTASAAASPAPAAPRGRAAAEHQQRTAGAQGAAATGQPPRPSQAQDPSPEASMLSSIRANWLRPPGSLPLFRCRFRVGYSPGGMVTSVEVIDSCGTEELDGSVIRAVWKTQPLPMAPAGSGSVDIEFSP